MKRKNRTVRLVLDIAIMLFPAMFSVQWGTSKKGVNMLNLHIPNRNWFFSPVSFLFRRESIFLILLMRKTTLCSE